MIARETVSVIKRYKRGAKMKHEVKIIVEKHPDGFVAYPLGLKGVVVGEGDSYEEALADVKSAIAFHIESFGAEVLKPNRRFFKYS
jgi:predicted RNase H-like HicB family nuclease